MAGGAMAARRHVTADARAGLAARNNAAWCDAVCRAHGSAGRFGAGLWWHDAPSPPFYPNLVTLRRDLDTAALHARLRALKAVPLPARWGVKDSFRSLALEPLGFEPLFDATWLWRDPAPCREMPALRFEPVETDAALAEWEIAWRPEPDLPRIFPPALRDQAGIVVLGASAGGRIVAGAIFSRTDPVLGVSNTFAPPDATTAAWTGLAAAAHRMFPGLPLVGYEQDGPDLRAARTIGFAPVGPLRVWTCEDAGPA